MSSSGPDVDKVRASVDSQISAHWKFFLIEGLVLLALGMVAVILPAVATVAIAFLVGWLLLASGVIGLIATFSTRGTPGFVWSLLSGIAGLAAGIVLLEWPISGAFSLTVILTVFLVLEGIVSILYSLEHKRELSGRWGIMLLSGVVDLALASMIFLGLPDTAAWAIGLLVGVNLAFGGWALVSMALSARRV